MSDPLTFENSSPRFGLPFLYVGQAQKEFYVNEALRARTLLHCAIEGTAATPPATPANGDAWHIASAPTGEWSGQSGKIASWQAGLGHTSPLKMACAFSIEQPANLGFTFPSGKFRKK
jgi:hypothetical protein